jgi:hypothetical protein
VTGVPPPQANVNKSEDFFVRERPSLVYGGIGAHFQGSILQNSISAEKVFG